MAMRLGKPSDKQLQDYVERQRKLPFSYAEVGGSRDASPAGFTIDHNRVCLGHGAAVYDAACEAMRQWRMFPATWTRIYPSDTPLEPDGVVALVVSVFGLWWLNACRIVYVVNEPGRFGFAYGTLPGHVECGEERFLIERDADDRVWYDIRAFSRPRHPLVRLMAPLARRQQRRFVRDSQAAMLEAVRQIQSSNKIGAAV